MARANRGGPLRFLVWTAAVFAVGLARGGLPAPAPGPLPEGRVVLIAKARSGWIDAPGRRRLEVDGVAVRTPGIPLRPFDGRVRLTVITDDPSGPCPAVLPGDRLRALARVRRPWTRCNPGVPDSALWLQRRGVDFTGVVLSCDDLLVEPGRGSWSLRRTAERARSAVRTLIASRPASEPSRALLAALTIGDAGRIPPRVREDFQRAGLAHLLAVSGLHLGFVALGLYWLLVWMLVRIQRLSLRFDVRKLAAGLVIPVTVFYTLLAGARLPSVRASVAVIVFLLAVLLRRRTDPLQTLAAACLVVLGLWPQSLLDVGFQLSFAATGSVLLLLPRLAEFFRVPLQRTRLPEGLLRRIAARALQLLLVSAAATLGAAPLVAWHFHQVSLVGLAANLLAVPLAAWLIVPLGLACALSLAFSPILAGWLADVGLWLADVLAGLAGWWSAPSWAAVQTAGPTGIQLVAWYAGLLLALHWNRRRWTRWALGAAALVFLASWGVARLALAVSDELQLTVIDVGQGDSIFIRLPGGENLLVDGGGSFSGDFDTGRHVVAPFLWAQGVGRLAVVVATHRHPDHVGGLASVVELFDPEEVWIMAPLADDETSAPLARAAVEAGAGMRLLKAGDRPLPRADVELEVLWPDAKDRDLEENERSLVLRLKYGRYAFLLTGDLEREGEAALLDRGVPLRADVLKVGHHGSRHATSEELLQKVRPSLAVISVGAHNRYRLPHQDVLDRLQAAGVRVYRTDRHGAVTVRTDGEEIEVSTCR